MQVQLVKNQPNFGIKCVNKGAWNPKVLEAFEKSNLIKEIDAKYSKAEAFYNKINDAEFNIINSENEYTTIFDIILQCGKKYRWSLSSRTESVPDKYLIEKLKTITLKEVEEKSSNNLSPYATIEITAVKQPNIFQRLCNKLFGNKK